MVPKRMYIVEQAARFGVQWYVGARASRLIDGADDAVWNMGAIFGLKTGELLRGNMQHFLRVRRPVIHDKVAGATERLQPFFPFCT